MSYILDALRRSQAERERGQLPHLHAQPATLGLAPVAVPMRSWLWPGLAAVALLLLGALVLLLWLQRAQPAVETAPVVNSAPITPIAPIAPIAAAPPPVVMAAPAAVAPPLPIVVSAPPAAPALVSAKPELTAKAPVKAAAPALAQVAPRSPAAPPALPPAPPPAPTSPKVEISTLTLAQLSADQRRELPPLVVGGSVWSDNAASRFVILNGQLLHEGESVAPGAVVERIGPKTAWVRWRDLRLELPL
jgi:general secretion pathway protein B